MIDPADTSWPSPALTPRRWPTLSRPFFELEPAFLCAICSYSSFFFVLGVTAADFDGVDDLADGVDLAAVADFAAVALAVGFAAAVGFAVVFGFAAAAFGLAAVFAVVVFVGVSLVSVLASFLA